MKKIILSLLILIMIIVLLQGFSFATTNEEVQIIKKGEDEYMIYFKEINEEFEFAFSNVEDKSGLIFKDSATDQTENGNYIAYVDTKLYTDYFQDKSETYLWVKQDETYKIEAKKIELANSLTEEDIQELNQITQTIKVKIGKKELPVEDVEGVKTTRTIGTINIDDDKSIYSYIMVKSAERSNVARLIELASEMNEENLQNKTIFEKLSLYNEVKKIYNELRPTADNNEWVKLENNIIEQPQESKEGDQYLVWIKKQLENDSIIDLQIMTCDDEYKQEYEKQQILIRETSKLPITGDSITLFVIAGIILLLIIVVAVLKVKDKNKSNEK